jgi:hypothetical protein
MELNFGSIASENVIEIELGTGPVESGVGFITIG